MSAEFEAATEICGPLESIRAELADMYSVLQRRECKEARRERIATAALQGILAMQSDPDIESAPDAEWLAKKSVQYADALISKLNKLTE